MTREKDGTVVMTHGCAGTLPPLSAAIVSVNQGSHTPKYMEVGVHKMKDVVLDQG